MINGKIFEEPKIEFRYGQSLTRPHDGLSLFGPFDSDHGSCPGTVAYAVIGTTDGINAFQYFGSRMSGPVHSPEGKSDALWPVFPGFDVAFGVEWPSTPAWTFPVDREQLLNAANLNDRHKRVHDVVDLMLAPMEVAQKRDEQIRVIICVVPDEVWKTCRPTQSVTSGIGEKITSSELKERVKGNAGLFDKFDPEIYQLAPDFRRQLKARALKYGVPIQIIRESTLNLSEDKRFAYRGMTPLSDRMWNLATALYYKAGGKPWRLANAREGVCYVGIAFRLQNPGQSSRNGCCAAQMFLNDGDGVVFLGESGPWYAPDKKQFHISPEGATSLLAGVLKTYAELHGKPLTEVFLHSRSGIDEDEFEGYKKAVPEGTKVVAIRVRKSSNGIRFFRQGTRPILRGTYIQRDKRSCLLWTAGFKPELRTYDGVDVPLPLAIDIQHGDANIEEVAKDIFGLTKLNYNTCKLGDSQPVTVAFSDSVGEILISNPGVTDRRAQFRFYV